MAKKAIYVVDDEEDILELLRYNLEKEGYAVKCISSGEEALVQVKKGQPDLMILDLMLPGIDGFEVCRSLKGDSSTSHIPIVILSAKGEDSDVVAGLELGADDYVTKPFTPKVLIARIRTVLRRRRREEPPAKATMKIGQLAIDPAKHCVTFRDRHIDLTATEFTLLKFLAARPGWVFTRGQLIDATKGGDYPVTERSVDVQIVGLRKKLGSAGNLIETVHGVGYRFKE